MHPNEAGLGWAEAYLGGSPEAAERRFREFEKTIVALQVAMAARGDGVVRRGFHAKTILICVTR